MKRSIKITSALLVLVLLLAQVVCVSAASWPKVTTSVKQTDHYIKTVSAKVESGKTTVTDIYMRAYKADKKTAVDSEAQHVDVPENAQVTMSMEVRPSEASYVRVVVYYIDENGIAHNNDEDGIVKWVTVGSNGYYNPSSNGSSNRYDSDDYWDGFRGSSSTSSSSSSSSSSWSDDPNETNVWEYVGSSSSSSSSKPSSGNTWTGYYEDRPNLYDLYTVNCRTLNVRAGDGTNYAIVGTVHRGDIVQVYDIEDGWAVIRYEGRLRYVSANYLNYLWW